MFKNITEEFYKSQSPEWRKYDEVLHQIDHIDDRSLLMAQMLESLRRLDHQIDEQQMTDLKMIYKDYLKPVLPLEVYERFFESLTYREVHRLEMYFWRFDHLHFLFCRLRSVAADDSKGGLFKKRAFKRFINRFLPDDSNDLPYRYGDLSNVEKKKYPYVPCFPERKIDMEELSGFLKISKEEILDVIKEFHPKEFKRIEEMPTPWFSGTDPNLMDRISLQ
jgi:hypothetical protein